MSEFRFEDGGVEVDGVGRVSHLVEDFEEEFGVDFEGADE